jgi:hypothetical protein
MTNLENLNDRVEKAVQKFHKSEDQRRSENQSLSRVLNDLETKFEARTRELDDCQVRINELEESNVSLTALVCQLVEIVEKTANETEHDPLYRASSAASDIVERFVSDNPLNHLSVVGPPAEPAPVESAPQTAPAPAPAPIVATPAGSLNDGTFEDIEGEFLMAEGLYEKTEGATEFPKLVFDAIALAGGQQAAPVAAVDQPIDIPEPRAPEAAAETSSGSDLDIKEIMARLELAAERAQLRTDGDARRDEVGPPMEQDQARSA